MIRCFMAMLIVLSGTGWAAELTQAAASARTAAEQELAEERTRIITARSKRLAELADLTRLITAAQVRLTTLEAETSRYQSELDQARLSGAGSDSQLTSLLGRFATQIERPLPAGTLSERTQALATELLAIPERLAAQASWQRTTETVHDRTGRAVQVPVIHLGRSRAFAAGDEPASRGALDLRAEVPVVSGPPLPPELEAALADPQQVVLDLPGTWATQVPLPHRTLGEWIRGGRLFIWPILAVGAIGLLLAGLRTAALARFRPHPDHLDAVRQWLAGDRWSPAPPPAPTQAPLARVLAVGLATLGRPTGEREAALDQAVIAEAPAIQRGLSLLLLLASIAPLLGLLGTVTGMIDLFAVIGSQGSGNARALSGGISEALITTQAGMLVAVPLLVAHALLNRAAERRLLLLEEAASTTLAAPATGSSEGA
jgi:biopolymer transport protein ExbB